MLCLVLKKLSLLALRKCEGVDFGGEAESSLTDWISDAEVGTSVSGMDIV